MTFPADGASFNVFYHWRVTRHHSIDCPLGSGSKRWTQVPSPRQSAPCLFQCMWQHSWHPPRIRLLAANCPHTAVPASLRCKCHHCAVCVEVLLLLSLPTPRRTILISTAASPRLTARTLPPTVRECTATPRFQQSKSLPLLVLATHAGLCHCRINCGAAIFRAKQSRRYGTIENVGLHRCSGDSQRKNNCKETNNRRHHFMTAPGVLPTCKSVFSDIDGTCKC
jgi:hypothetical protein